MNSKKGFGLLEVMAAAVVLGFLVVALTRLQLGNREAILRIRTRDAAQIVAQEFIDKLSAVGLNSISNDYFTDNGATIGDEDDANAVIIKRKYVWEGKSNSRLQESNIKSETEYTIRATIDHNYLEETVESSLSNANTHVRAKKVDLTVSWPYKNSTQSISLSRIIK